MTIIDPAAYNRIEQRYKLQMPIVIRQALNLEVFEKFGFPIKVDSIVDLRLFLNTMQDGRFKQYFDELGGITQSDNKLFLEALKKHLELQKKYFPNDELIVPLDIMMSGLLIAKKLHYFVPDITRILEIGPGVGQTSFFLSSYVNNLKSVCFVEACQSFYILQSLTFDHVYGESFKEHGHDSEHIKFNHLWKDLSINEYSHETTITNLNFNNCSIHHYPYFKFPEIKNSDNHKYDLIMANACLNEISIAALNIYLDGIKRDLISEGGYLFYQCPGLNHDGRNIVKILNDHGFNPMFISSGNHNFDLTNSKFSWKSPTPTGLFKFTGKPISLSDENTLKLSCGHATYILPEIVSVLERIQRDTLNNISFEKFCLNINNEFNILI